MDVTALLILSVLALSGLITPSDAVSGFSNPAVITIWAMFILGAGLTRTNVAYQLGSLVIKYSGKGEARLIIMIMLVSGLLSAFMNNIGVAAIMLPVVMSVARRTSVLPSRLLMPMAFGTLLGGYTTLLTTINLLISDALNVHGFGSFKLFDFAPVGIFVLAGGIIFVGFFGRRLLPKRDLVKEAVGKDVNLRDLYSLQERTCIMKVPQGSVLAGKSIADTHLGSAAGLTVLALIHNGKTQLAPPPDTVLRENDKLIIEGRLERFKEFRGWLNLHIEPEEILYENLVSDKIKLAEIRISPDSTLINKTVYETNFRRQYGVNVLAVKRNSEIRRSRLPDYSLKEGDLLLIQGSEDKLDLIKDDSDFDSFNRIKNEELTITYHLQDRMFAVTVPHHSELINKSLSKSRMGAVFGLRVLAIFRNNESIIMPDPEVELLSGDKLLVEGRKDNLEILRGLQELEIEEEESPDLTALETDQVGLIEATLSPRSSLAGKTLREIHFRSKYGMQVIAIWREGRAYRTNLRDMPIKFGDGLLILGRRDKLQMLRSEPDFIVLSYGEKEIRQPKKAPLAAIIMAAVLIPVIFNLIPISIAAVTGAVLMILTNCLTIEDAYRSIDWRSVFLIAGMLPLGIAMQQTGAVELIAQQVSAWDTALGPWGIIIAVFIVTVVASTVIPTAALIVMLAPIMLTISSELGVSPYSFMMALSIAGSTSFLSPISHPANVLVMGPGGYQFSDYLKLGLPLTLVVMVIGLLMLSVFWPLYP